jgi:hypothetical protein
LAYRVEEAKNSAKLLTQVVQSTPPSEVLGSDLIKEFADRCLSASRSVQAYMTCENPAPDNETMETLIETNEQLNRAMNQHQRTILNVKKAASIENNSQSPPARPESGFTAPPQNARPAAASNMQAVSKSQPPFPPPGEFAANNSDWDQEDPFQDPKAPIQPPFPEDKPPLQTGQFNDSLGVEPYHPGFKESSGPPGRQGNILEKEIMHGGVQADGVSHPEDDDDNYYTGERKERNVNEDGATSLAAGHKAEGAGKAPIYRY